MKQIIRFLPVLISLLIATLLSLEKIQAQETPSKINVLKYVRVYADSVGESHFEDLEIDLNKIDFAPPAPPIFTSELNTSTRYGFISVSPGWKSGSHPAPERQFILYLSGIIEAEVSD